MFSPAKRRYTGAKTKLLTQIDESLKKHFNYSKCNNLSFFDVFAGTGVLSEYFLQKPEFKYFFINDFLESNFVIYQGFFSQESFNQDKIDSITKNFKHLQAKSISDNYYVRNFGGKFFSINDSKIIGYIRENLDILLNNKTINKKEFYILLASLLYSADKVANTVGHYDAYRKNIALQDKFDFMLIDPIKSHSQINIYKQDSNDLARDLKKQGIRIDVAFIDPPYNSRQYARFYHFLETLTLNNKPQLYGIAKKPEPTKISEYCKTNANKVLKDLLENLSTYTKYIVMTYNNTYTSKSNSSQNKISLNEIQALLQTYGITHTHKYEYKAFSSGKTDTRASFKEHKEYVFICEVGRYC